MASTQPNSSKITPKSEPEEDPNPGDGSSSANSGPRSLPPQGNPNEAGGGGSVNAASSAERTAATWPNAQNALATVSTTTGQAASVGLIGQHPTLPIGTLGQQQQGNSITPRPPEAASATQPNRNLDSLFSIQALQSTMYANMLSQMGIYRPHDMMTPAGTHLPLQALPAATMQPAPPPTNEALKTSNDVSDSRHGSDGAPNDGAYSRILSMDQDIHEISPYQCLVRQQIEVFEQPENHFQETTQGRNRPIVPGQVGIRCRHCGSRQPPDRTRGAILFPSTLMGVYQTAQNMANAHLLYTCRMIPDETRKQLHKVRSTEKGKKTRKSAYGGGNRYWADSLSVLGVVDTAERRLKLATSRRTRPTQEQGIPKAKDV